MQRPVVSRPTPRWALLLLSLATSPLAGQGQSSIPLRAGTMDHAAAPRLQAAPLTGSVHLDGRLDEPAWASARPVALATQRDPDEGRPPTEATEIRVLVGQNALYLGARMRDSDASRIVRRLGRRDDEPNSDRLTIRIDSRHDHLTAFVFDVYPAGNKGDASAGSDGNEDSSWDPVWDVATQVDSLGWTAEIRIPLSQLRYDRSSDEWGIQIVRFIQRKQEEDVLSYIPKTENGSVNRYGHLEGMRNLPAPRRLELMPYVSGRAEYTPKTPGNPFRDGSDYFGSAGGDLRLGVTSDLTLDATINPDFGQVEVDPAVVNLTAFETVFPEKRPFFVEGSDLFRFGQLRSFNNLGTPTTFFSRRIGRSPQGGVTDPNATFDDVPAQTTIAGAVKLTGKTRSGWSIAALDAVTPEEAGRYVTGSGSPVRRQPVEPFSNYAAARVRREFNQGNTTVGALVTSVNRSLGDSVLRGALRSNAYLGGLDLGHSWGQRNWALDLSYAASRIEGSAPAILRAQRSSARYYQRPDSRHLEVDSSRTSLSGHAAQVALTKQGGGHWAGSIALQEKSPGYETNDLGLTQTVGRRGISTDIHYYDPKPGKYLRDWTIGFQSGNDWNFDGDHTTKYVGSILNFRFHNFWSLNTDVFYNFSSIDDQITRGGPVMRLPDRGNAEAFLQTSGRGPVTFGMNGAYSWNARGGYAKVIGLSASVRPSPTLRLRFEPSFSRIHRLSQYVAGVTDPTATATFGQRSVFAVLDQRELALDTRLEWTWSPKVSLQLFLQPLISTGDYSSFKEFRRPGTFQFDVYGRDRGTIQQDPVSGDFTVDPDGAGPAAAFGFPQQDFNFRSLLANVVFRWEYRPGSTLFLVWQQARTGQASVGDFSFRRDFGAIFDSPATNVLAVKLSYWLGV